MQFVPAFVAVAVVSGCVSSEPVVSSYNGSSVSIQTPGIQASVPPSTDEIALAAKTCQGPVEYASGRKVADATIEYLFICRKG